MSLRTRKSKKQKLNRRKSLKIGGALKSMNQRGLVVPGRGGPVAPTQSNKPTTSSSAFSTIQPSTSATTTTTTRPRSAQPTNPLCNINVGDLVQLNNGTIEYVKNINGPNAILSNDETITKNNLAKYEYHDILTSLSNILNFVLESKNTPPIDKPAHITKINALKASLKKNTTMIQ